MAPDAIATADFHPAPHRKRVRLLALIFPILAPSFAWSAHLVVNFALSSHACYPDGVPLRSPASGLGWLWSLLLIIDLAGIIIGLVSALIAWRTYRLTAQEMAETGPPLAEIGEGRTRFLALWGVLIGVGFSAATFFDFVGLWVLPLC
ncbi:MAG: hypothetical protein JOY67_23055 [Hyphomicrobiales bacterium]|nr:hypothetical protein [Hyphomicrobiales bacterium]MBV9519936.1 hypothetical protein [Hyphomicrobiales bacterium]